ncbi:MAG: Tat pathway signal protein [Candidatus Rokuibacteriota bacterium]|nr:MAG: Tat pathway signal protein [Candidatus Rokubacteria bacterium]
MMQRLAATMLVLVASIGPASAQDTYPNRPITMVVPFPPGGVADLTARPVAAAMERVLKNPVGVVNKQGAAGAVGMQSVAVAKPDGYTLLLALSSISIIPEADKLFNRPPAFTVDQFAPIALISADPTILVVPADKPWKTAKDFIEILGGHVDALASGPAVVLPHIKAGKLRALAGWGDKRVAALPDVPTLKELGYPDAEFYIWAGVFAPKGTAEPVLAKLRATVREAVNDSEFKAAMDKLETPVTFKQGDEFQRFFDADAKRLAEGVRRVGRVETK